MTNHERRFIDTVWSHYRTHGRDMPWRKTRERPRRHVRAYHILVSELMLQQTQVPRVIPKYKEFINHFPGFKALADASTKDVLAHWKGLGYNRRAVHLKHTAERVTTLANGRLPQDESALRELPGIGPYTARAVQAFAFNTPSIFIETNIRTAFLHHFFQTSQKDAEGTQNNAEKTVHDNEIYPLIERTLERDNPREWYYALMDYGAALKEQGLDLNTRSRHYTKQSKFEGSNRQKRSQILQYLLQHGSATAAEIMAATHIDQATVLHNADAMVAEGLLEKHNDRYTPAS